MKLILCISFLLAVQLCSCQYYRTDSRSERECYGDEGNYCREKDFYYQGRDHYYPGRGSYDSYHYRESSYNHPRRDYSYEGRNYDYHYYYPRDHYQGFDYNYYQHEHYPYHRYSYYPGRENYHQRYPYPRYQDYDYRRYDSRYRFEYFSSCRDILQKYPDTPSGFYYITSGPDKFRKVYCEMEKEFCGSKGWEKFYYMDFFKNDSHTCPGSFQKSFRYFTRPGDTTTGKHFYCEGTVDGGCTSAKFYLDGSHYSEICAKIGGYQYGLPTAFKPYEDNEKTFMDGVYFSYGEDTRYLWGYAVGSYKHYTHDKNAINHDHNTKSMCPDVHPLYKGKVPYFVEHYYYCDSGAYTQSTNDSTTFFYKNRLFEGKDCEFPNYSCMRSGQPWFYRKMPTYFYDYIEMSSCNDDKVEVKDVRMDNIEVYLR